MIAEGDLPDRALARARELARDADVRLRPPADLSMEGAPAALRTVSGSMAATRDERVPIPGTALPRVFKRREYRVTVLTRGFEYDGQTCRSLSAVEYGRARRRRRG